MNALLHAILAILAWFAPTHQPSHASRSEIRTPVCTASPSERWIIARESSGNVYARNGDVFGLGQLTSGNRQAYGHRLGIAPDTTDRCEQLRLMRAYANDRYGSASSAVSWWQTHGWY